MIRAYDETIKINFFKKSLTFIQIRNTVY
jgi:hypothetical protein